MGNASQFVFRFLDTNGDGTGTKNANGNYGAGGEDFYYQVPANKSRVEIHRMVVHITDTAGILQDEYGNLGAALTTGFTIQIIDSDGTTVLEDLCDGIAIKANVDWGRYCYDVKVESWGNTPANESVQVRWTFARAGRPIILDSGQRIQISFSDDFSGLIEHYFMLQGIF